MQPLLSFSEMPTLEIFFKKFIRNCWSCFQSGKWWYWWFRLNCKELTLMPESLTFQLRSNHFIQHRDNVDNTGRYLALDSSYFFSLAHCVGQFRSPVSINYFPLAYVTMFPLNTQELFSIFYWLAILLSGMRINTDYISRSKLEPMM